jgi:multidrug efflux pump subunit AcrB
MMLFGFVGLCGVVVNDAIVMIKFIQDSVKEDKFPFEAVEKLTAGAPLPPAPTVMV